jgi:hypothetical protein
MTIETLLESTPEELEKMSDDQLREFFAPYLVFVRPPCNTTPNLLEVNSLPHGSVTNSSSKKRKPNLDSQMELLEELARKKGLL